MNEVCPTCKELDNEFCSDAFHPFHRALKAHYHQGYNDGLQLCADITENHDFPEAHFEIVSLLEQAKAERGTTR